MDENPPRHELDPGAEVGLDVAAAMLGITVAHLEEILANGAIAARSADDGQFVRVADIQAYRDLRARRRRALLEVADVVDRSRGGWDA